MTRIEQLEEARAVFDQYLTDVKPHRIRGNVTRAYKLAIDLIDRELHELDRPHRFGTWLGEEKRHEK